MDNHFTKRPHVKVMLKDMKTDFHSCLTNKLGFKGFEVPNDKLNLSVDIENNGEKCTSRHGSVVIATITSCTNTSNLDVMVQAGLVFKKSNEFGFKSTTVCKDIFSSR